MEHRIECKRLENISEILMIGNDMQMTLGLSYLVTVYASRKEMDLYHLHLVFDIVAFVGYVLLLDSTIVYITLC